MRSACSLLSVAFRLICLISAEDAEHYYTSGQHTEAPAFDLYRLSDAHSLRAQIRCNGEMCSKFNLPLEDPLTVDCLVSVHVRQSACVPSLISWLLFSLGGARRRSTW
jgi:hypothetical protein